MFNGTYILKILKGSVFPASYVSLPECKSRPNSWLNVDISDVFFLGLERTWKSPKNSKEVIFGVGQFIMFSDLAGILFLNQMGVAAVP